MASDQQTAKTTENAQPTAANIPSDEKNDPSVKQALKKEPQPSRPEDLSPIHNTKEVGTSGGDQRERENDPVEGDKGV